RQRLNANLAQLGNPPFTQTQSGIRKLDSNVEPCPGCYALGNGVPANGREPEGLVPFNWQWNVSVQRELVHNTTLELSYVGNRGSHLVRRSDANQVGSGDINRNGVSDRLDYVRASGSSSALAAL